MSKRTNKLPLNATTVSLMRRLLSESVRPHAGRLLLALVCMGLVAAATAASAWLMKPVVNDVFLRRDAAMLWPIGLAVIAVFVVKGLASYGQGVLMSLVGQRIIADTQVRLFRHIIGMDLAWFHGGATGNLISRFTMDAYLLRGAVSNALTSLGKDALSVAFLVGLMFYEDWLLASVAFFVFPLAVLPIVRLGKRMRKVSANTQKEMGALSTTLNQSFQGVRHVKAYGMEVYETSRVEAISEAIFRLTQKAARVRSASHPIMETLGGVAVAVVILYGGHRVISDATTPGAFFAFVTALLMAYQPMKALANLNTSLQEGLAAAQRLFEVLDQKPAIVDRPGATALSLTAGTIAFDGVDFAYGPEQKALDQVSLTVPGGKTTALVGASGGGKSTVLNLIPRFYDVAAGSITVDGTDVRDVTLESLRANIALVSQEISLFDDTVRANIAYGRWGAGEEEIVSAARSAAAHDFIMALPQGYDTVIGEHGVKLSGGQRQRLAIARAMLKNAPILLLDEATSALDTESERQVQDALRFLMKGRTTLVIAHRLSTVIDADVIHVVDRGRVVESGTHAELLARGGVYARLYALQFAEDEAGRPAEALAKRAAGARV